MCAKQFLTLSWLHECSCFPWSCAGQTTGYIWALKYYIFPISDLPHRPPSPLKIFCQGKILKKFQAKAIQGHVPWLNLKKMFQISFFTIMQVTSEPLCSDPSARLKIQIPMHSISWGCLKKVRHCDSISLLINIFGIHLEPGCESRGQIIHYRTAKNVQKQATVLHYFSTNSYELTRKVFPVVWPACPCYRLRFV